MQRFRVAPHVEPTFRASLPEEVDDSTTPALGGSEPLVRGVLSVLALAAPSPGAFACVVGLDARAPIPIERMVDGSVSTVHSDRSLESTFGLAGIAGATNRLTGALVMSEPWAADERLEVPYLHSHSAPDGFSRALIVACARGEALHALAGVERRSADPPFSSSDVEALSGLAPLLSSLGEREVSRQGQLCMRAVLDVVGVHGSVFVVDCDRHRIVWDSNCGLCPMTLALERHIVRLAAERLAAESEDAPTPTPPRLANGTVVSVRPLCNIGLRGGRLYAVQVVFDEDKDDAFAALSEREHEVAGLLVAGYTSDNIGARFGVSPNTIRTYTRRLYAKLGIVSRVELVHRFLRAPARSSSRRQAPIAGAGSPAKPSPGRGVSRSRVRARTGGR
jgi:DNA-binding CsgD family transcriptional regulator